MDHARLYVERFGLSVIPMGEDKRPMVKWAEYQDRTPTLQELEAWPHVNLAIITGAISNLVVVDCESRADALWFWEHKGKSPVVCRTRRGFHFYFRHPDLRVKNGQRIFQQYDVRGDGGYVLAPPSKHSQGRYAWVQPLIDPEKLPVFRTDWRPEVSPARQHRVGDGAAYIAKIRAVSGQGGHNDTFRAAWMLRHAGYTESEALLALQGWNRTNAEPPWSDHDLLHKIKEVYRV